MVDSQAFQARQWITVFLLWNVPPNNFPEHGANREVFLLWDFVVGAVDLWAREDD